MRAWRRWHENSCVHSKPSANTRVTEVATRGHREGFSVTSVFALGSFELRGVIPAPRPNDKILVGCRFVRMRCYIDLTKVRFGTARYRVVRKQILRAQLVADLFESLVQLEDV